MDVSTIIESKYEQQFSILLTSKSSSCGDEWLNSLDDEFLLLSSDLDAYAYVLKRCLEEKLIHGLRREKINATISFLHEIKNITVKSEIGVFDIDPEYMYELHDNSNVYAMYFVVPIFSLHKRYDLVKKASLSLIKEDPCHTFGYLSLFSAVSILGHGYEISRILKASIRSSSRRELLYSTAASYFFECGVHGLAEYYAKHSINYNLADINVLSILIILLTRQKRFEEVEKYKTLAEELFGPKSIYRFEFDQKFFSNDKYWYSKAFLSGRRFSYANTTNSRCELLLHEDWCSHPDINIITNDDFYQFIVGNDNTSLQRFYRPKDKSSLYHLAQTSLMMHAFEDVCISKGYVYNLEGYPIDCLASRNAKPPDPISIQDEGSIELEYAIFIEDIDMFGFAHMMTYTAAYLHPLVSLTPEQLRDVLDKVSLIFRRDHLASVHRLIQCLAIDPSAVYISGEGLPDLRVKHLIMPVPTFVIGGNNNWGYILGTHKVVAKQMLLHVSRYHQIGYAGSVCDTFAPEMSIWISRSALPPKNRHLVNEVELEILLEASGWYIYHPEQYPFEQQIQILSQARVIAGTWGGAFSMLFAIESSHKKVIMLDSQSSDKDFENQFAMLGIDYTIIRCLEPCKGKHCAPYVQISSTWQLSALVEYITDLSTINPV